jgi:pilus assembly protein CpaE
MQERSFILLASRSKDAIETLAGHLVSHVEFAFTRRQLINGDIDPLSGLETLPDVLVLRATPSSANELAALAKRAPDERVPLIVIGAAHDPTLMRLAMQAGARDFLSEPVSASDFHTALQRVATEARNASPAASARMFAFINAKGGSGATFLAANVAHAMATVSRFDTLLVDADLHFGTLPQYLDLQPKRGLLEALDAAGELDGIAADAFLTRHQSGLRILARAQDSAVVESEGLGERFAALMQVIKTKCHRVVFDVPRHLDVLCAMALQSAERIVVVTQQTLPHLRDGTRLVDVLHRDFGISPERITVLVNRYRKDAAVDLTDIQRALGDADPFLVPNDFRPVNECIDAGVPIYEHARRSPVTRAIVEIANDLGGSRAPVSRHGLIARTLHNILRT